MKKLFAILMTGFVVSCSVAFAAEGARELTEAQKDVLYFGRLMAPEIHGCVGEPLCATSRYCPVIRKSDGATVLLVFMLTPADLTFGEDGRQMAYRVRLGFKGTDSEILELPVPGDGQYGRPIPLEQVPVVTEMLHAGRTCVEILEEEIKRLEERQKSS